MQYLQSDVTAGLANLSNDINLAARNAVSGIVDYIVNTYAITGSRPISSPASPLTCELRSWLMRRMLASLRFCHSISSIRIRLCMRMLRVPFNAGA